MRLFEKTRALAAYRLRPEGDQLVANLWKTLDVARAYEAAGPTTLRTLVRFLEEETEGGAEEGDSPVGDQAGAQVEVVTVHKAKGLEYPIVILGDLLYGQPPAAKSVLRHAEGRGWLKIGGFEPEGWGEAVAAEKLQAAAEDRRLLYVALTRARDHLVVPCLPGEIPKGWMAPIVQGFVEPGKPAPFGATASSRVEGGTKNGKAKVTYVDSPSLTFAGAATDRVSPMAPLDGGEDEARDGQGSRAPMASEAQGPVIPRSHGQRPVIPRSFGRVGRRGIRNPGGSLGTRPARVPRDDKAGGRQGHRLRHPRPRPPRTPRFP